MAVYFAGDMHLRTDHPDRSERLARWARRLAPDDSVYLVGDVCDFWFVAREQQGDPLRCPGLKALADFKARGGDLTILSGNHDHWLGPLYRERLGATFVEGPIDLDAHGLKIHTTHGHKVGGRPAWKSLMESRRFLDSFSALPRGIARRLDVQLNTSNHLKRIHQEGRLLPYYHRYADKLDPATDLVVFGHIHTPCNNVERSPRLIILGSWHEESCYLKVDGQGAKLITERDAAEPAVSLTDAGSPPDSVRRIPADHGQI